MTRAAIIGAGSLGTIIGALMTKGGRPVELVDTNWSHVERLNALGARITGEMDLVVHVHALTPDRMEGRYDMVFLLSKQTANAQILAHLLPHLHEGSLVCTLQNGIPEPSVAAVVGGERTMGGAVGFGATWEGAGRSRLTTRAEVVRDFAFEIGAFAAPHPLMAEARAMLGCVGRTQVLDDLMGVRWSKLLMNATFSGMSAALGCTFGEVLDDPLARAAVIRIAAEVVRAAHAEGRRMALMQGEDFEAFGSAAPEVVEAMLDRIWMPHRALRASMLQDLEKGRPTEIAFINGLVCDTGRSHGFATPMNDLVTSLVRQAQDAGAVPTRANISHFARLLDAPHLS
ncbi:MAG: 2-dehydropantoate 2-reductase [Paracoccaceae bacterium]|nr:2-dehydropantoate 2-reductase [Paracoccaceae bacterium]